MWGEQWGVMIWGQAAFQQVPIAPWALMLLGFLLGVCAVLARRSRIARTFAIGFIALVPVIAVIAVNLPHTFQNGTIADADEVNDNFDALNTAVENAEKRISYSAEFTLSVAPIEQCTAWKAFRASIEPKNAYCVRITGSEGRGQAFSFLHDKPGSA